MFNKLKKRWRVNGLNLFLIICTFALGGSLCGYLGKRVMALSGMEKGLLWWPVYIVLISFLWPFCVIVLSIPLGQFRFFKNYLAKIWRKMSGNRQPHTNIAIFASGAGSNAQKIIDHFRDHPFVTIRLIVCNKAGAGVLDIAGRERIATLMIEKNRFANGDGYMPELTDNHIDFIVLAGFLWKMPATIIHQYPNKIVNIHPALLPKYGGKGMYGSRVHEAVIAAGENESGISIHYVDELYDHGQLIFQASCAIDGNDNADTLAAKVHQLEHAHFPRVINELLQKPK